MDGGETGGGIGEVGGGVEVSVDTGFGVAAGRDDGWGVAVFAGRYGGGAGADVGEACAGAGAGPYVSIGTEFGEIARVAVGEVGAEGD